MREDPISLRIDPSRLGIVPSDRTSPSGSATATAIVSAWTSNPKNHTFFMDRFPFRLWALRCSYTNSQYNPRIEHRDRSLHYD